MLQPVFVGVIMSASFFWTVLAFLVGVLILQGVLLRVFHRRTLLALQSQHEQALTSLHGEFEQMRLRMLQLQRDHVSARQAAEGIDSAVQKKERPAISARQALERQLEDDVDVWDKPPSDGFEDTQILAHEAHQPSLLMQ
jgi:hypothetical protein